MGDVSDILGMVAKPLSTAADEAAKLLMDKPKSSASKKSKPKGISRELFSLMGIEALAPAIVTVGKSQGQMFKSKRMNVSQGKWIWAPFHNSARK